MGGEFIHEEQLSHELALLMSSILGAFNRYEEVFLRQASVDIGAVSPFEFGGQAQESH